MKVEKVLILKSARYPGDYEGILFTSIQGKHFSSHIVVSSPDDWLLLKDETEVDLELWVSCYPDYPKRFVLPEKKFLQMKNQNDPTLYKVSGCIISKESDEIILLETDFHDSVLVDLELPSDISDLDQFNVGDFIEFSGVLKMSLP